MPVTLVGVGHAWADGTELFAGLDRTFTPGRICALIGPSGSGKSTLLSIIAGMTTPSHGTVERDGDDRVLWVFQNPYGVAKRSVLDHVALPFLSRGLDRRDAELE
ncbi:MAG: ATP-binding cassette domain-containing protein, partial [Williamsia herbipolensis]|nr:ATP-binding cassette domain-containing protein [Williamsia herbipolensis]